MLYILIKILLLLLDLDYITLHYKSDCLVYLDLAQALAVLIDAIIAFFSTIAHTVSHYCVRLV